MFSTKLLLTNQTEPSVNFYLTFVRTNFMVKLFWDKTGLVKF